ncbi:hypothetical protein [Kosakonia pseudosacchari]|uniref:Outer membrane assembly lipoprotein YfiO n=1 Tax=Kosakonia pseudosacchari TaxID=1646340 RepID=A0ABX4IPK6_9ENTR|nr:hypothetical protein [Kosakonia pseudosacchari]PDO86670.1 hypothetical protein BK796_09415 [Kosakonia pseudosacchari]
MIKRSRLALGLCLSFTASAPALASSDIDSCTWGSSGCFVTSPPVLGIDTDTRDNLLRLVDEQKGFLPLRQPVPQDFTRSRSFYFGVHHDDTTAPMATAEPISSDDTLRQQMKALGIKSDDQIPPALLRLIAEGDTAQTATGEDFASDELENRFVSRNNETLSGFFAALLDETALTPEQRLALAKARMAANGSGEVIINSLSFPQGSVALGFRTYLHGANAFYAGDYAAAAQDFTVLTSSPQPWLAETASYMLMRTALNASSVNANGEYGDFDVTKVDKAQAQNARDAALHYLKSWPQGRYAESAQGMLRRINWYLQDWNALAALYEQALSQTASGDALIALVNESDNKLLEWGGDNFISTPDASLMTFILTLRRLRDNQCDEKHPCIDQAWLDSIKADFDKNKRGDLWNYLRLKLAFSKQDYATVRSAIPPAQTLPPRNILAFSEQVLYGEALMAQKQWPEAKAHWLHLLELSKDVEQQQLLQAKLAATLVESDALAQIFAPDSKVTNLRYRSLVLKTKAPRELLRQQASSGPNNEERTIALHTLLTRDLTEGHYVDWLQDKKLIAAIAPPVTSEAFDDVNLSAFGWKGTDKESVYFCAALEKTVTTLSQKAQDGHALNCLGEFFRITQTRVNRETDLWGNDALDDATKLESAPGVAHRLAWYQQVINDAKAEPEDKSYALYRAVMCYAPSGYNDCGGEDVDKSVRKAWFQQLKSRYPGSVWAKALKYYW